MTIRLYKGQLVAVTHKTSHGKSQVQNIALDPNNTNPTEKWQAIGPPYEVDSRDVKARD